MSELPLISNFPDLVQWLDTKFQNMEAKIQNMNARIKNMEADLNELKTNGY